MFESELSGRIPMESPFYNYQTQRKFYNESNQLALMDGVQLEAWRLAKTQSNGDGLTSVINGTFCVRFLSSLTFDLHLFKTKVLFVDEFI